MKPRLIFQHQKEDIKNKNKSQKNINCNFFCHKNTTIDFLKIDVEGHEIEVMTGAEQLFKEKRINLAVIEILPKRWSVPYSPYLELILIKILKYGYSCHCLSITDDPLDELFLPIAKKITYKNHMDLITFIRISDADTGSGCIDWMFRREA